MTFAHTDLTDNTAIIQPEGHTNFYTVDGELLTLANDVIDNWSPSQKRWLSQAKIPQTCPEMERRVKLAAKMWKAKGGFDRPLVTKAPRKVTRFQFWLRNELTSLGLI